MSALELTDIAALGHYYTAVLQLVLEQNDIAVLEQSGIADF